LANAVAERASQSPRAGDFNIEVTGSVAGISHFFAGSGSEHPDMLNTSRRMRMLEIDNWKQVNPQLPDAPIMVLGPPKSSSTRDSFAELAMEAGCG
jgi:ABC-type phosphate transport system substrate-binding protein